MHLVLGSTSEDKLHILQQAITATQLTNSSITTISASSGISDQPLSLNETEQGAKNRARAAFQSQPCDIGIGMEGGLEWYDDVYHLICSVALYDGRHAHTYYMGYSDPIALPQEVSTQVQNGAQFGEAIRQYADSQVAMPNEQKELLREIISREKSFTKCIQRAMRMFLEERSENGETV